MDDKLRDAFLLIRDFCRERLNCDECPFLIGDYEGCVISETDPMDWDTEVVEHE